MLRLLYAPRCGSVGEEVGRLKNSLITAKLQEVPVETGASALGTEKAEATGALQGKKGGREKLGSRLKQTSWRTDEDYAFSCFSSKASCTKQERGMTGPKRLWLNEVLTEVAKVFTFCTSVKAQLIVCKEKKKKILIQLLYSRTTSKNV